MKYLLILACFLALTNANELYSQAAPEEAHFLSMVVPTHFIKKKSENGVEKYESNLNRSLFSRSKEYKSVEDGFLSAQSAADFDFQTLSSEKENIDVNVVSEKYGPLTFSVISWVKTGEKQLNREYIRAYNDDGQFIHCFEMSSTTSTKKQLAKAFKSFLKTCKPNR